MRKVSTLAEFERLGRAQKKEYIREHHPEIFADAYREGVKAENERVLAIDELVGPMSMLPPGIAKVVRVAKLDGKSTAGDVALLVAGRMKLNKDAMKGVHGLPGYGDDRSGTERSDVEQAAEILNGGAK